MIVKVIGKINKIIKEAGYMRNEKYMNTKPMNYS